MIPDEVRMQAYLKAIKKQSNRTRSSSISGPAPASWRFLHSNLVQSMSMQSIQTTCRIAEEMARANGFSSKIKFIKDLSTNVTLDEQADVIVSDLRGALPLYGTHIPSIMDARSRLLKPGGQ